MRVEFVTIAYAIVVFANDSSFAMEATTTRHLNPCLRLLAELQAVEVRDGRSAPIRQTLAELKTKVAGVEGEHGDFSAYVETVGELWLVFQNQGMLTPAIRAALKDSGIDSESLKLALQHIQKLPIDEQLKFATVVAKHLDELIPKKNELAAFNQIRTLADAYGQSASAEVNFNQMSTFIETWSEYRSKKSNLLLTVLLIALRNPDLHLRSEAPAPGGWKTFSRWFTLRMPSWLMRKKLPAPTKIEAPAPTVAVESWHAPDRDLDLILDKEASAFPPAEIRELLTDGTMETELKHSLLEFAFKTLNYQQLLLIKEHESFFSRLPEALQSKITAAIKEGFEIRKLSQTEAQLDRSMKSHFGAGISDEEFAALLRQFDPDTVKLLQAQNRVQDLDLPRLLISQYKNIIREQLLAERLSKKQFIELSLKVGNAIQPWTYATRLGPTGNIGNEGRFFDMATAALFHADVIQFAGFFSYTKDELIDFTNKMPVLSSSAPFALPKEIPEVPPEMASFTKRQLEAALVDIRDTKRAVLERAKRELGWPNISEPPTDPSSPALEKAL